MGTRSLIKVEGMEVALYKHWDGYPTAIMPWLIEFYGAFYAKRGFDDSYCLAQLIRSSVTFAIKYDLDPSSETGYGIVPATCDCGEEYTYTLLRDGSISVNGYILWKHGDVPLSKTALEKLT